MYPGEESLRHLQFLSEVARESKVVCNNDEGKQWQIGMSNGEMKLNSVEAKEQRQV